MLRAMITPEFSAYVAPARLYPQIWRLILGLLLILFIYAGFLALVMAGIMAYATPMGFFGWMLDLRDGTKPVPTLVMLFTFVGFGLGAIITAPACHYRSPGTLFGPFGETLRGFVLTVVISLIFFSLLVTALIFFDRPADNLPFQEWLKYLPYALPLLLIQTASEEMVFRAYLPQQLAARFASRFVWMLLPALLFASLHWNPKLGVDAWLVVGATFVFALISTDLVVNTGSLGASMGLHFVNNIFALLVVSMDQTITGLSLFVTPMPDPGSWDFSVAMIVDLVALLILWRILRFALSR